MKKAHSALIAGGIVASITATIGTIIGTLLLDRTTVRKALGSKIAGDDDDMGAEGDDPIINVAKTL